EQQVVGMQVDLVRDLLRDLDQEPAVHVHDALGPAGRARGVRDEQRMLAGDARGVARLGVARGQLVPVVIAPLLPRDLMAEPPTPSDVVPFASASTSARKSA